MGFWQEHSGSSFPSIFDASVNRLGISQLKLVEKYLMQCPICIASPGLVSSAFDKEVIAGTSSIRTDGVWAWHDTLSFYVKEHSLALPIDFLGHISERKYVPLEEAELNVDELNFSW